MQRRRLLAPFEQNIYALAGASRSYYAASKRFSCIGRAGWIEGLHFVLPQIIAIDWSPIVDYVITHGHIKFVHMCMWYVSPARIGYRSASLGNNRILILARKISGSLDTNLCAKLAIQGGHIRTLVLLRNFARKDPRFGVNTINQHFSGNTLESYLALAIEHKELRIIKLVLRWVQQMGTEHYINYSNMLSIAVRTSSIRVLRLIAPQCKYGQIPYRLQHDTDNARATKFMRKYLERENN